MKSSTKDQFEGAFHELKGKIKEISGIIRNDPKMEVEGIGEKVAGKAQKKYGQIEKVMGK